MRHKGLYFISTSLIWFPGSILILYIERLLCPLLRGSTIRGSIPCVINLWGIMWPVCAFWNIQIRLNQDGLSIVSFTRGF